jgi:hypothetical protein
MKSARICPAEFSDQGGDKMNNWMKSCIVSALLWVMPSSAFAMSRFEPFIPSLVSFLFVVVMFLVFREVVCWYWKINVRIELLTEIRDLLKNQAK